MIEKATPCWELFGFSGPVEWPSAGVAPVACPLRVAHVLLHPSGPIALAASHALPPTSPQRLDVHPRWASLAPWNGGFGGGVPDAWSAATRCSSASSVWPDCSPSPTCCSSAASSAWPALAASHVPPPTSPQQQNFSGPLEWPSAFRECWHRAAVGASVWCWT